MGAPNVCETCGKEYYSDTEYEQHLLMHQQRESMDQIIEANKESGKNLAGWLDRINMGLLQMGARVELDIIYRISIAKNISYEDACKEFESLQTARNKFIEDVIKKAKENKNETLL